MLGIIFGSRAGGHDVYWIDDATASKDTSMHLSVQAYTTWNFYWKVLIQDGELITIIAPANSMRTVLDLPKPQNREEAFHIITVFPLQSIIDDQNPNEDTSFFLFQLYGDLAGLLVTIGGVPIRISLIAFTPNP